MSDERFDRIEVRLDRLEQGQEAVRSEIGELRAGQEGLRDGYEQLRAEMRDGHEQLRVEMREGQQQLRAELKSDHEELRRHMGVLHEEVMDRIQALTFNPEPLRREFRAADDAVREDIGRRLDPIEAALRSRRSE